MFRSKTVLVLGAGASFEAGFPLGKGLISDISKLASPKNGTRYSGLFKQAQQFIGISADEVDVYLDCCDMLHQGLFLNRSIDSFLEIHSDNERLVEVGKLAIAYTIAAYEANSCVSLNEAEKFRDTIKLENSWYHKLFVGLTEGLPASEVDEQTLFKNLTIITFNYDRSVEFFLLKALRLKYSMNRYRAEGLVRQLPIFHMYGSLGDDFEQFGKFSRLNEAHELIETYAEKRGQFAEIERVQTAIAEASNIIFMGFAYHEPNVKLIAPRPLMQPYAVAKRFYSTTKDVSETAKENWFNRVFTGWYDYTNLRPHDHTFERFRTVKNGTCAELFEEYQTSWFE